MGKMVVKSCIFNFSSWYIICINILRTPYKILLQVYFACIICALGVRLKY